MEGKVLLQDLAQSLASNRGMQRKDAETFLKAFFETISEGILQDKMVKIKGLGTIKMIEVQERESVNVNTGERIVIPGHSKINFTPDVELKDQVNKPFALFQTVIINEGTSLEDMEKIGESPVPEEPESPDTPEEPETQEVPELPELPEEPSIPEIPKNPETPEESELPEVQDVQKVQEVQAELSAAEESKWWYINPAMLALLFAFFWVVLLVGYFIGSNNWVNIDNIISKFSPDPIIKVDTVYVEKSVEPDSVYIQSIEDSLRNVIHEEAANSKEQPKEATPQVTKTAQEPVVKKKTPVAYEIVGQKGVRTIQWGDYLLKIVRQEYGTDDALKYVVSYNNFKDPNNLPVGTEVRLPKLKEK